jgi:hypothetical protein
MRVGVAALLVLVLAAGASTAATAAGARVPPRLRIVSPAPVTVVGTHFAAHERVSVRIGVGSAPVRVVRADRLGSFSVRFAAVSDPCTAGLLVSARGAAGDWATAKAVARACPPAP